MMSVFVDFAGCQSLRCHTSHVRVEYSGLFMHMCNRDEKWGLNGQTLSSARYFFMFSNAKNRNSLHLLIIAYKG